MYIRNCRSVYIIFLNVVRIMIITMVGYYKGVEAMLFVHTNLGWILFVFVMMIFWYMVMREKGCK